MFQDPTPVPYDPQKISDLSDQIEEKLKKLGVYVLSSAFATDSDDDGNIVGEPYFVFTAQIGSFAWSPAVQNPEQDKVDTEFRGVASDVATQEFEAIRERERERRARGLGLGEDPDLPDDDGG